MATITERVAEAHGLRQRAQAVGDRNMEAAMDHELERMGIAAKPAPAPTETATPPPMTTAVPPKPKPRGGRPKLPRCPHGNIEGRCGKC